MTAPGSPSATAALLAAQGYIADEALSTVVYLALTLGRPLLLEGEPGTGKTEIAVALAAGLGRRLVRLQCYDGMDLSAAAYEWDRARQLLAIRLAEARGPAAAEAVGAGLYGREYLLARPLLAAIDPALPPAVLLIDELDRADAAFEAFLLELLADYALSIPEFGTVRAVVPPVVVLTSNRTRDVHDAVRRRCLFHWVDFPDAARERAILAARAPEVPARLAEAVTRFVQAARAEQLFKAPGVAETLDWARALAALTGGAPPGPAEVDRTLGVLVKYPDDLARLRGARAAELLAETESQITIS